MLCFRPQLNEIIHLSLVFYFHQEEEKGNPARNYPGLIWWESNPLSSALSPTRCQFATNCMCMPLGYEISSHLFRLL